MNRYGLPPAARYRDRSRPERNALGRLIELEAAFQVLGASLYIYDAPGFKRKLSMLPRRTLFTITFAVLDRIPARRIR